MGIDDDSQRLADQEAAELLETMQDYSNAFDKLSQERHEAGAAEYGQLTFLENDVIRMMAEELADTANYCRMQFIKLMMINNMLVDKLAADGITEDDTNSIGVGVKAFKGTKDTGWGKN